MPEAGFFHRGAQFPRGGSSDAETPRRFPIHFGAAAAAEEPTYRKAASDAALARDTLGSSFYPSGVLAVVVVASQGDLPFFSRRRFFSRRYVPGRRCRRENGESDFVYVWNENNAEVVFYLFSGGFQSL